MIEVLLLLRLFSPIIGLLGLFYILTINKEKRFAKIMIFTILFMLFVFSVELLIPYELVEFYEYINKNYSDPSLKFYAITYILNFLNMSTLSVFINILIVSVLFIMAALFAFILLSKEKTQS